ncbi:MAG: RecQ family zinc-binding domain-containing protein, partial [Chitinophagaceae bacterium]|nr:RecQ family zinc-binding domain-containing protein [Chitinophagaceae bacterium]
ALNTGACRSMIIGKYFGDAAAKACGICDNCLNAKKQTLDKKEFEDIRQQLLESIVPLGLPVKDALAGFSGAGKEKALKVIGFLQAEDKIEVNEEGWIRVK